jgi:hypothetical protein
MVPVHCKSARVRIELWTMIAKTCVEIAKIFLSNRQGVEISREYCINYRILFGVVVIFL